MCRMSTNVLFFLSSLIKKCEFQNTFYHKKKPLDVINDKLSAKLFKRVQHC